MVYFVQIFQIVEVNWISLLVIRFVVIEKFKKAQQWFHMIFRFLQFNKVCWNQLRNLKKTCPNKSGLQYLNR